jgi:hypothetical protein
VTGVQTCALPISARFYDSALELAFVGSLERARLLFKLGRERYLRGESDPDLLASGSAALVAAGDNETAAEAEAMLADVSWRRGERDLQSEHLARARDLIATAEPSRAKAYVLGRFARYLMMAAESTEAVRVGRAALALAAELGLDELRAHALNTIGSARVEMGDLGGIADLEESMAIAVEANAPSEMFAAQANLAAMLWELGELERAYALMGTASQVASRFGQVHWVRFWRGNSAGDLFVLGRWEEALAEANAFIAEVEAGAPNYLASSCYVTRAQIRLGRDDLAGADADARQALDLARVAKDPSILYGTAAACALVFRDTGRPGLATALANEFLDWLYGGGRLESVAIALHLLAWTLVPLGRGTAFLQGIPDADSPWVQAARAFAEGDLRRAADICAAIGAATEEARDRLWLAEWLIEQNRRTEADAELQRALAFYRLVGATRYIREAERLLAASA